MGRFERRNRRNVQNPWEVSRMKIRGVVCAGGTATRLGELTRVTNKHLIPVGNEPMIFGPLGALNQILETPREVCLVCGHEHVGQFIHLLQDGSITERGTDKPLFELDITYRVQVRPLGIAQAIGLAENFANEEPIIVILGDNLFQFSLHDFYKNCTQSPDFARIMLAKVEHPEHYGIAEIKNNKLIRIVEKPKKPISDLAVTGVYYYPFDVFDVIKTLKPSRRGELEVTDINNYYLKQGRLSFELCYGWWEDAGESQQSLIDAGNLVLRTGKNNIIS